MDLKQPPKITPAQQAQLGQTGTSTVVTDPYNLDVSGFGALAGQVIQGASDFFGLSGTPNGPFSVSPYQLGSPFAANTPNRTVTPHTPLTATDVMGQFVLMSGSKLAQVQSQLFRAGYYGGSFVPDYGKLRPEDIAAFRSMLIGLAANPSQGNLKDFLAGAASDGDATGINVRHRAPLVVKLSSPDDLRAVLQKGAQELYGGNLPEADVQRFIAAYQGQQSAYQTAAYTAGGFNPDTGQQDLSGLPTGGGTVVAPPAVDVAAEKQIRAEHPLEVATQGFVNNMNTVLQTFTQGAPGAKSL